MASMFGLGAIFGLKPWRPGIGDPSVVGWFTVAVYFTAAALCFVCFRRLRRDGAAKITVWWWLALSGALFLLALNKQLDFQTLFTQLARDVAWSGGWYERRRDVQAVFVVIVALVAALGTVAIVFALRRASPRRAGLPPKQTLVGFVLLVGFIVVRAASFHHLDVMGRNEILGLRLNWIIELGALALILWGCLTLLFEDADLAVGGVEDGHHRVV